MKTIQMTSAFDGSIKPAHKGVYLRELPSGKKRFSFWDGEVFGRSFRSAKKCATIHRNGEDRPSRIQNAARWVGVKKASRGLKNQVL